MKFSTEKIIMGVFALDDTITATAAKDAMAILRAGGAANANDDDRGIDGETAAAMLGVSRRSLQTYADKGLVRRIGGGTTHTRTRYSMKSIRDFLNGKTAVDTAAA